MTSYIEIINTYNLAKTDASLNSTMQLPHLTDYGADANDNKYITYTFF